MKIYPEEKRKKKPHYPWWSYIKAIVQEYPNVMHCTELSGTAELNRNAVESAIMDTARMANGRDRLKVVELLHWSKPCVLTLEGAALLIPCSRSLAAQWQREFFEKVARSRTLLD